jgi:hypothetical protein
VERELSSVQTTSQSRSIKKKHTHTPLILAETRAANCRYIISLHVKNAVSFYLAYYSESVSALISAVVHSTSENPFACSGPEAATKVVNLSVLRQVFGTFGRSLGSWRRMMASTKYTALTCMLSHSKKCIYNETNKLTNSMDRSPS